MDSSKASGRAQATRLPSCSGALQNRVRSALYRFPSSDRLQQAAPSSLAHCSLLSASSRRRWYRQKTKLAGSNYVDEDGAVRLCRLTLRKRSISADTICLPESVEPRIFMNWYDESLQSSSGNRAALTSQYSRSEDPAYGHQLVANPLPTTQFGVSLQHIKHYNGGSVICPVVEHTIKYLRDCCLDVEGLFRRSCSVAQVQEVQEKYNRGDSVDFRDLGNPHLAAVLLKTFLRELAEPLLTFELYDAVIENHVLPAKTKVSHARSLVSQQLPDDNYDLLNFVAQFLSEVADNSTRNKMTALNLGIVFGPSLIWSRQQASLTVMKPINCFTQLLILHYNQIFVR